MSTHPLETEAPSPAAVAVEEALRSFVKAFRAWQLYLPNNPMRARAVETAAATFARCWAHTDAIRLEVREAELRLDGEPVHRELERPQDGLPWILYRDGLRELTLLPGFEARDLSAVLGLLQRARVAAPDEDDLVTMLWVEDLETVRYRYAELPPTFEGLPTAEGIASTAGGQAMLGVPSAESPMPEPAPPPGMIRVEDFDSTLYFLDRRELAHLQEEVRNEYASDRRRDVLSILLDLVELREETEVREEALGRIEELLVDLLSTGAYDVVAYALREATVAARRTPGLREAERDRLLALSQRLSSPAVVAQLLQAVDEGTRAPATETLEALVAELREEALAPLLGWLAAAPDGAARSAVERAAQRLAEQHTSALVTLLEGNEPQVARGALALATRLRTAAAVPALGRLLRSADAAMRVLVVQALSEIASPGALQALERALEDGDRDVRIAALRAITARRHAPALPRLGQLLRRKELRQADRAEKTAVFDAFGTLCGDAGVELLDEVLNARSLLGYRESAEMRACAARALGLVGTSRAGTALQRASDTRDVVVRNEVARALRGGAS